MTDVQIILTTHDRPAMFETALHSALATAAMVPDVETKVLVLDDASRHDYAGGICKRLGVEHRRWDEGVGYAWARVYGLQQTSSRYVAFLDDDDVLLPRWLPLHLQAAAEGYDVVAGSYWETDAELGQRDPVFLQRATLDGLLAGFCPVNDGALFRRDVAMDALWRPDRDTVMMFSLWLGLATRGASFGVVDEPTWLHRLHGGNMSSGIGERDAAWRAQAIAEHQPVAA